MLQVRNLRVAYDPSSPIIDGVEFSLDRGRVLAIVGESGSGKTTLCRALTRLFPQHAVPELSGTVLFETIDLLGCSESILQSLRKDSIRYIFQEPYAALNPAAPVERQMLFANTNQQVQRDELAELLAGVGLANPKKILRLYPHEMSVGMAQRIVTAMALLTNPSLLIADEPTSALDATTRRQIFDLLRSFQHRKGMTMILVTHNLAIAKRYADDIMVLRDGRIIELGSAEDFFTNTQHPYSRLLIEAAVQTKAKPPRTHQPQENA